MENNVNANPTDYEYEPSNKYKKTVIGILILSSIKKKTSVTFSHSSRTFSSKSYTLRKDIIIDIKELIGVKGIVNNYDTANFTITKKGS